MRKISQRTISLCMSLLMLISCANLTLFSGIGLLKAQAASDTSYDVNGDGNFNNKDLTRLLKHIAGEEVTVNEAALDANGDGKVNNKDLTRLLKILAGEIVVPPECLHTIEPVAAVEATCAKEGNIAYWQCTSCKKCFTDLSGQEEIAIEDTVTEKTEHTPVIDEAVEATPEKDGLTEGAHCSECGFVIVPQEPVEYNENQIIYVLFDEDDSYFMSHASGLDNSDNPTTYDSSKGVSRFLDPIGGPKGYDFVGWFDGTSSSAERIKSIPAGESGKYRLYAKWEPTEYKITYDSPDISADHLVDTYTVNTGLSLKNLEWFGYTFVGWSDDNGFILKSIEKGTTGDITLHANWTSNRNRATSYSDYGKPAIIEDASRGQFLFVYNIGKIDNVPLSVDKEKEYLGYTNGIVVDKTVETTTAVTQDHAEEIAHTVEDATTRSSGWTLSKEWNQIYAEGSEYADKKIKTDERTDSQGNVVGGNYFVSNSKGGSSYSSVESGGSSSSSSKVTTDKSFGINSSYDKGTETYAEAKLSVENKTEIGVKAEVPVSIAKVSGEIKNTTTIGAEVSSGRKDNEALHVESAYSSNIGTINTSDSSAYYNSTASNSSNWNSTTSYEESYQSSIETTVREAVCEEISKTTTYDIQEALGEINTSTETVSGMKSTENGYTNSVRYSKGTTDKISLNIKNSADKLGHYRLVTAGTVHVYGVVGYDVATQSYYTYTFNVLDKERHLLLDHSTHDPNFGDCENGLVTFTIPYEVNEYICGVTGQTKGLVFGLDDTVTDFAIPENFDGTVVVPQYTSTENGDGSYSAVKVTGFGSDVFSKEAVRESIETVILPMYVTEIPKGAFEGCTNLKTVIAYGVTKIGKDAFKGCTSLEKFYVDNYITSLGNNAFEDVKEIAVMAANAEVAQSAIDSGALNITLDISEMQGSFDNRKVVVTDSTKNFAIISKGATYNNLQIDSKASESTLISNMNFVGNTDTALKLGSPKVNIGRVTVENCPGFAMILSAENTDLKILGTIALSSSGENAVLSKNVVLSKLNTSVAGELKLTGNYLVCNTMLSNDKMLTFVKGELVKIEENEYLDYTSIVNIDFDVNCEDPTVVSVGSIKRNYKLKYGELPTPTRKYYIFDGWFTKKDGGEKITADDTVDALVDHTLYAHWTADTYVLAFDANGGTVSETEKTVFCNKELGELPTPTRDDCTFVGWFTEDGEQVTAETVFTTSEDVTLTAHWLSDWILASNLPEDGKIISEQWKYDLTTNIKSNKSYEEGFELYDTTSAWGPYGSWSGWSTTKYTKTDSRDVEEKTIAAVNKTQYNYSRWTGGSNTGPCKGTWSGVYCGTYQERGWSDSPLSVRGTQYSNQMGGYFNLYGTYNDPWYNEVTRSVEVSPAYKMYRYRDRSLIYTYYHTKTESLISETEITTSDVGTNQTISNIQKWVKYTVQ